MRSLVTCALALYLIIFTGVSARAEKSGDITITHSPASFAIKGQSLTLRAKVTGGSGGIDTVTLYYALFRDAAPFRVAMASSGMDMYVGTIEAGLLSGLASVSYYIEAQDRGGSLQETPWYDVQFRDPEAPPAASPAGKSTATSRATSRSAADEEGVSGMTVGLIAGGAVALGAGAYFIADSGGSDDNGGGGGTNDVPEKAGTYAGNCTVCETIAGAVDCETRAVTVIVDESGNVFSDSLFPGTAMSSRLSGNSFVLSSTINDPGSSTTGTITFEGNLGTGGKALGTVSGSFDRLGEEGAYSGSFNLSK